MRHMVGMAGPRVVTYVDLDLVGDGLTKLPYVRALRHAFPDGELVWMAGRGPCAYAGALAPVVGGMLDLVLEHAGTGRALAARLADRRVDVLIDTQGRLSVVLALRPRRFVSAALQWRRPVRLVDRLLALLERATGSAADVSGRLVLPPAATALAERLLPSGPRYVAQVVGAGGREKAWPAERHVELARALLAEGIIPVLILGPDEHGQHAALSAALPGARFPRQEAIAGGDPAGPELTIALAGRCTVGVAADCGGGHMLAASGIPLVSLFGPTDPAKFAPSTGRLVVLRAQGFGGVEMGAIPVDAVLAAVQKEALLF